MIVPQNIHDGWSPAIWMISQTPTNSEALTRFAQLKWEAVRDSTFRLAPKHHFGPREVGIETLPSLFWKSWHVSLVNRNIFGCVLQMHSDRIFVVNVVLRWRCESSIWRPQVLSQGAPEGEQDLSVRAHQTFPTPNLTAFSVRLPDLEWLKNFICSLFFVLCSFFVRLLVVRNDCVNINFSVWLQKPPCKNQVIESQTVSEWSQQGSRG